MGHVKPPYEPPADSETEGDDADEDTALGLHSINARSWHAEVSCAVLRGFSVGWAPGADQNFGMRLCGACLAVPSSFYLSCAHASGSISRRATCIRLRARCMSS